MIEIRQLPNGKLTAWHAGEMLPMSVKLESHSGGFSASAIATFCGFMGSITLGPAVSPEELRAVSQIAPDWFRPTLEG